MKEVCKEGHARWQHRPCTRKYMPQFREGARWHHRLGSRQNSPYALLLDPVYWWRYVMKIQRGYHRQPESAVGRFIPIKVEVYSHEIGSCWITAAQGVVNKGSCSAVFRTRAFLCNCLLVLARLMASLSSMGEVFKGESYPLRLGGLA